MFDKRWHLFTVGGQKIYLEPTFLLLIAVFVFMGLQSADDLIFQLLLAPVVFFGVLFHELGHAIAIRLSGYGNSVIVLRGFGGVTLNQRNPQGSAWKEIGISLAGPAVSLLLAIGGFVGLLLYEGTGLTQSAPQSVLGQFFFLLMALNALWAFFNLLPVLPMDGGKVLHAVLRLVLNNYKKALLYTAYASIVLLAALAVGTIYFGMGMFIAILLILFGIENFTIIKRLKNGGGYR